MLKQKMEVCELGRDPVIVDEQGSQFPTRRHVGSEAGREEK